MYCRGMEALEQHWTQHNSPVCVALSGQEIKGKRTSSLQSVVPPTSYRAQTVIVDPSWLIARLVEDEARSSMTSQHQTPLP